MVLVDEAVAAQRYPIRPDQIDTTRDFGPALGDSDTAASARWVVMLAQSAGYWRPFSPQEICGFYRRNGGAGSFCFHRLVSATGSALIRRERDGLYRVSARFILLCFEAAPRWT